MLRKMAAMLFLVPLIAAASFAYESRLSRVESWELAFESRPPRVIEVVEGTRLVQYTYVVYQVTNNGADSIDFHPSFELETGDGALCPAGLYPRAEQRIRNRFGESVLGFRDIAGPIKPGESKRGVAVFKGVNARANDLTVYVAGLTGDFKMTRAADGMISAVYRTFMAVYHRPGDGWLVTLDPVTLKSTDWIWRGPGAAPATPPTNG